jgi:NAD(P)-dependent dehydrogenase (short-subunit alcohol dehydrogenase family)
MSNPLAVITGASTGIGFELVRRCVRSGYDALIAADEPEIHQAAKALRAFGQTNVESVKTDLATAQVWKSW